MDTRESNTAWIISGILLVLLVIVGYLWLSAPKDRQTVIDESYDGLVEQRAELTRACQSPEGSRAECDEELENLAELLREYSDDLEQASTSAALEAEATAQ